MRRLDRFQKSFSSARSYRQIHSQIIPDGGLFIFKYLELPHPPLVICLYVSEQELPELEDFQGVILSTV